MDRSRVQVQTQRIAAFFALERNVLVVAGAMFLLGFGEELWRRFMPKYLEAYGAPVLAIGLYGTMRDLLDGLYQYPGGWIADHYGRRRALLLFVALATVGYAVYWMAPSWPFVFLGLVFVMAWSSMASPTLFAVVGDALPKERRAMGFTVQSILRRVPIIVAPTLGGLAIAAVGVRQGVHIGLVTTIGLAVITLVLVARVNIPLAVQHAPTNIGGVWRSLPAAFHRLLASDVFIRTSEGLVDVFLVLYTPRTSSVSPPQSSALSSASR
jgi:MFS family permease